MVKVFVGRMSITFYLLKFDQVQSQLCEKVMAAPSLHAGTT
jgi:hypothetical protein